MLIFNPPEPPEPPVQGVELQEVQQYKRPQRPINVALDDKLDASALVWLFTRSTDKFVVSAALQAIAGLPRVFSAVHILRDAGAVQFVERGFQSCFEKDTTIDLKWHLVDPDSAWLYCKAWMNLTWGESEQWPLDLLDPLWILQDLKGHPDSAAIASCVVALSSVDSHTAQWELLKYLSKYTTGDVQLNHSTLSWLLDSIIVGLVRWEMPVAVVEKTTVGAIPILLRLLQLVEDMPTSNVRSATGLALYVFACGPVDLHQYWSEEQRRQSHCDVMLKVLSTIVAHPERFGVKDILLDLVAKELSKLAPPLVAQSHRFSSHLREIARSSLFKLFNEGLLGAGIIPDVVLADVLHLLNPIQVPREQHPSFVKTLVSTLLASIRHQGITSCSIRLLEPLLSGCTVGVLQAFTESNGINIVLRVAKTGDNDNPRLQIDCWRVLYAFINSTIALCLNEKESSTSIIISPPIQQQFASIFQSELFQTLCVVITAQWWWLFDASGHWVSALVQLCRLRPYDPIWRVVIKAVRDSNERGGDRDYGGMPEMLYYQLDAIIRQSSKTVDFDDPPTIHDSDGVSVCTTMTEHVQDSASGWFGP